MERSNAVVAWLHNFKISIIKKEYSLVEEFLSTLPQFDTLDQMHEAQALITEAESLFSQHKEALSLAMKKNRNAKKYLNSES